MKTFWILEETREGGREDNCAYYTASLPALCPEDGLPVIGTGSSKREAFSRLAWNLKACVTQAQFNGKRLPASTLTTYKLWAKKQELPVDAGKDIIDTGDLTLTDVSDEAGGGDHLKYEKAASDDSARIVTSVWGDGKLHKPISAMNLTFVCKAIGYSKQEILDAVQEGL